MQLIPTEWNAAKCPHSWCERSCRNHSSDIVWVLFSSDLPRNGISFVLLCNCDYVIQFLGFGTVIQLRIWNFIRFHLGLGYPITIRSFMKFDHIFGCVSAVRHRSQFALSYPNFSADTLIRWLTGWNTSTKNLIHRWIFERIQIQEPPVSFTNSFSNPRLQLH